MRPIPAMPVCENGHTGVTIVLLDGTCVACGTKVRYPKEHMSRPKVKLLTLAQAQAMKLAEFERLFGKVRFTAKRGGVKFK